MTEFTINLEDPLAFAAALRSNARAGDESPDSIAAWSVAVQIEAQLPKPVPEEPTGDVVVFTKHDFWRPQPDPDDAAMHWISNAGGGLYWGDLLALCAKPVVYRREPSPEAVEALAEEFSKEKGNLSCAANPLREFAARLLGQGIPDDRLRSNPLPDFVEHVAEATGVPMVGIEVRADGVEREFHLNGEPERQESADEPQPVEELVGVLSPDGPWIPASKVRGLLEKWRQERMGYSLGDLSDLDAYRTSLVCEDELRALLPEEGR